MQFAQDLESGPSDTSTPATWSVRSDGDASAVIGASLGTPVIPAGDDDVSTTNRASAVVASSKPKRDQLLQLVMGEPAPESPKFPGSGRLGIATGNQCDNHTNFPHPAVEEPKEGESLEQSSGRSAPLSAPLAPPVKSLSVQKRWLFAKFTALHWALVTISLLLLVLIIVLIWAFVAGPASGSEPIGSLSMPLDSPTISPLAPTQISSPVFAPSLNPSLNPVESSGGGTTPAPALDLPTTLLPTEEPTVSPSDVATSQPTFSIGSETLQAIRNRGIFRCGVMSDQDGFSMIDPDSGTLEGFEVDLCRAVAAAVFGGTDYMVELKAVTATDRFLALQNETVDMLASHTTHTMDRDVYEAEVGVGFTFSTPYLYEGLAFGGFPPFGSCANNLSASGNCTDMRICVLDGTTHVSILQELIPSALPVVIPSLQSMYQTLSSDFCNVIAGEQFQVAEAVVRSNGFTQEYEVGTNIYSHEPLALVTREDDPAWSDLVEWVVHALIAAEEQGITQSSAGGFTSTEYFGASFTSLFRDTIGTVGNYGEIGPGPKEGGTLQRIRDRGHLRCGIARSTGFGEFNPITGVWSGLDAEICKAVSAAIFNGVSDDVDFRVEPATERFVDLATGQVDLLSRITTWTLERDINEPTSGVGFSFSQPDFYDGLAVGGIPPYGACADNLDTVSEQCQGLKICVNAGTTTIDRVLELFVESVVVPQPTGEDAIKGLSTGACNAVAGGSLAIATLSVQKLGYVGPYETGLNRFAKEPLAVVTRQDDPQFTAFVNWVVTATFYAEEKGITELTANSMPSVSLFGPLFDRMLIDAIQAVGNYGSIYARSVEGLVPRGGLNSVNLNPFGPQHYPPPGL